MVSPKMKIKVPRFEIPPEDPFRDDLMRRKLCADQLTELIRSYEEPLVLCINTIFGNGKTTFLRMWREDLRMNGFKTLYFNAWENDHSDDALASLIGEFSAGMKDLGLIGEQEKRAARYLDQAKQLGAGILKKGIPAALRIATAGLVDLSEVQEENLSKLAEEIAKEQITKYEETKKTLSSFKDKLKSFAEEATKPSEGGERKPLVVMVDELDRCRPPYAVQILEKIKHLFNVPGIFFVIAADKEQLGCSVQSMYGQGMNVNGYLRRFIDLVFVYPTLNLEFFAMHSSSDSALSKSFKNEPALKFNMIESTSLKR
jgi:predicted KAP-like P-loop ATPase